MNLHLETRAIHAAAPELNGSRPVSVPIYQTSTFAFADPEACAEALNDPGAGFAYSRYRNPTTSALEDTAADLEGGAAAIAASSGMGAINAVLLTLLRAGDHVIAQRCLYGGTFSVFASLAGRYGIDVTYITGRDPAELAAALRPESRLLFLETIAGAVPADRAWRRHRGPFRHQVPGGPRRRDPRAGGSIRVSVGLEHPEDLWADFGQALAAAARPDHGG